MEIIRLAGILAFARRRVRALGQSASGACIPYVTGLSILLAFALLCSLSSHADAARSVGAEARFQGMDYASPVTVLAVHDAVVAGTGCNEVADRASAGATGGFDVASAGERGLLQDGIVSGVDHAATTWRALLAVSLTLVALTIVSLSGWCRAHLSLKRAVEKLCRVESERQRRCTAIEAREHAARRAVAARVATAAAQERDQSVASMRLFVSGPLRALAGLLEALDGASASPVQQSFVSKIQSAVCTYLRTMEDMLATSSAESPALILDEDLMDLRELIDGVVVLFMPMAAQTGLHLSVSIDRSVALRILADSARLGQIVFHLVGHAVRSAEHGLITVAVRAEPLNAGSQRIVICVRDIGAQASTLHRAQLPWPFVIPEPVDVSGDDKDSAFALCQRLAHRMGGELAVSSEPGFWTCRTFSAPFAVEPMQTPMEPPMEPAQRDNQTSPAQAGTAPLEASSAEPLREQFDRSYLAALADEGIELRAFMRGWYQSIDDDLKRMHELCERHDVDGVRESLHRLSGAVGLVGARSLMEALRRTSAAESEPDADVVHALAQRVESLKRHLDSAIDPPRSNLQ